MVCPPGARRRAAGRTVGTALAVLLCAVPVAAQRPPDRLPGAELAPLLDAVVGAIVSLVVCGVVVLVARDYAERTTDRIHEAPGETFLYGLGLFLAGLVLVVLLALTIVGVVLVVPLVVSAVVFGHLGYLAVGRAVVDDWGAVLLVAVVVGAFAGGVPILGGLVGFVLSCTGFGAWYLEYRDGGRAGSGGGSTGLDPVAGGTAGKTTTRSDGTGKRGSTGATGIPSGSSESADATGATDDGDATPADEWTAGFDDGTDHE